MKSLFALLTALCLFAPAHAKSGQVKSTQEPGSIELTQLLKLNSAGVTLMAAADEVVKPAEICELTSDDGYNLSRPLQSKVDDAIAAYIKARDQQKSYAQDDWKQTCIADCACGLYTSILERVGFESLRRADQLIYRRVSSLAMAQTKSDVAACARKASWFCSSDLLRDLRKEAAEQY